MRPYKLPYNRSAAGGRGKTTPESGNSGGMEKSQKRAKGGVGLTYICADIHGCYDKYRALLKALSLKGSDTLYVLGDVIDRGPDGIKILQDMMARPNVAPILGNHEFTAAMCLPWLMEEITETSIESLTGVQFAALQDWLANGGEPTLRALRALPQSRRQDILDYIRDMDLYAEIEAGGQAFVLAHAGLDRFAPDKPLEEYELEDFLFGRPTPESVYWPDRTLIFGHTPTRLLWEVAGETPRDDIFYGKGFIDLDCGCVFDGRLGCLCLDTMEEIYV